MFYKLKKMINIYCSSCLDEIVNKHDVVNVSSKLTTLKEFKEGSLVHCSELCFEILLKAKLLFKSNENKFGNESGILSRLVKEAECLTCALVLPTCHSIKYKLLSHFYSVPLHMYAKKQLVESLVARAWLCARLLIS